MKSNKLEIDKLYDAFFLSQTFDSKQLMSMAKNEVDWVLHKTKLKPEAEILDVGCGTGRHLRAFLDSNFKCTGVDLSKDCIDLAKKNCPEIARDLFEDDLLNFANLNPKKYDLVFVSGATIGYSNDDDSNFKYINTLLGMVKSSGYIVFDFLNFDWASVQFKNRTSFWTENAQHFVLDDRKIEKNFLESRKVFIDKTSGQIKSYADKVRCFSLDEFLDEKLGVLKDSTRFKHVSISQGYTDSQFENTTTALGVLIVQVLK
jgi:SAM-dependent methyltransferase